MSVVGLRELSRNTGEVLDQIEAGESLVVTRRGRPVAALIPVDDARLEALALTTIPHVRATLADHQDVVTEGRTKSLSAFLAEQADAEGGYGPRKIEVPPARILRTGGRARMPAAASISPRLRMDDEVLASWPTGGDASTVSRLSEGVADALLPAISEGASSASDEDVGAMLEFERAVVEQMTSSMLATAKQQIRIAHELVALHRSQQESEGEAVAHVAELLGVDVTQRFAAQHGSSVVVQGADADERRPYLLKEIARVAGKLEDPRFAAKASSAVLKRQRQRLQKLQRELDELDRPEATD